MARKELMLTLEHVVWFNGRRLKPGQEFRAAGGGLVHSPISAYLPICLTRSYLFIEPYCTIRYNTATSPQINYILSPSPFSVSHSIAPTELRPR